MDAPGPCAAECADPVCDECYEASNDCWMDCEWYGPCDEVCDWEDCDRCWAEAGCDDWCNDKLPAICDECMADSTANPGTTSCDWECSDETCN